MTNHAHIGWKSQGWGKSKPVGVDANKQRSHVRQDTMSVRHSISSLLHVSPWLMAAAAWLLPVLMSAHNAAQVAHQAQKEAWSLCFRSRLIHTRSEQAFVLFKSEFACLYPHLKKKSGLSRVMNSGPVLHRPN